MYFKSNTNRGINQASLDGTNLGSTCDEYRTSAQYSLACVLGSRTLLKGEPAISVLADVAKPGFNAYRLLHLMGDVRLSATGGTTSDGVGVAATQSSDAGALQILVYNHVDGGAASSSGSKRVRLNVNNIPFAPGSMRVRHYMVALNRSNSYTRWKNMGRPTRPSQTQWTQLRDAAESCYYETTANLSGQSRTVTYPQNTYGVSLVVLSP